jgi:hypothetical protein
MSSTTTRKLTTVAVTATAIGATGFLAMPVAHAASCTVVGEYLRLQQHFGNYTTTTSVNAKGSALGPGVVTVPPSGTNPTYGTASGSINGRDINVHIVWADNKGTADFTGTIGDDGIAHGNSTGTPIPIHLWDPGPWDTSAGQLNCSNDGPGNQNPAQGTVNATVDLYDVPGGGGNVIGRLDKGDKVTFDGPCPMNNPNNAQDPTNGWCKVTDTTKNLTGAVWGEFISK